MILSAFLAGPLRSASRCGVLTLSRLAFYSTWNAAFAPNTVPVEIELISGMTTLTGPTNEELFSICIMRGHYGSTRMDYNTAAVSLIRTHHNA